MSWQAYVDTSLISTGKIDGGAIFSAGGDSVWAASKDFTVQQSEVQALISAFKDGLTLGKGVQDLHEKGLYIGGAKYFCIKADERSIYGKKGKEGIISVKTKQAILVAHYPDTVQPGEAAKTVEQLADYLLGVGY
ncbi:profilin, required for normal timing of actin polymerization in response to thermal stress [Maublancomyces gigas]|uniref:Profilin n=1 Tax=Discina gigas TaxID=1032678 RepID=A0ABR3GA95_9PEZI